MEEWTKAHVPPHDLDEQKEIVAVIRHTANSAIPTVGTSVLSHRNAWYYKERPRTEAPSHHTIEKT